MKFARVLNVRPDEWQKVTASWLIYFLLLFGLYIAYFARESLFLRHIGADALPIMYIVNALAVVGVTGIYSTWSSRFAPSRWLTIVLGLLLVLTASVYVTIRLDISAGYVALHTLIDVAWTVVLIAFWNLNGRIFDSQSAKRLIAIIASGWTAAMVVSGLITPWLVERIDVRDLVAIWMIMLAPTGLLFRKLMREHDPASEFKPPDPDRSEAQDVVTRVKELTSEPYVVLLASLTALHWLILYCIDFYTSKTASGIYTDAAELAAFYGRMISTVGGIALGLQLLVTGRLIKFTSVTTVLGLFPFLLLLSSAPMLVSITLGTLLTARITEYALGLAFYDTSFQLLYNPLSEAFSQKVRAFLDGTIKPLAIILSGALITLLSSHLPQDWFPYVFMFLVTVFLFLSFAMRRHYQQTLIQRVRPETESNKLPEPDKAQFSSALIREGLKSDDPSLAAFALEVTARTHDPAWTSRVLRLVRDERREIRLTSLRTLRTIADPTSLPGLDHLLDDIADEDEFIEALKTYAILRGTSASAVLRSCLSDERPRVRIAACDQILSHRISELADACLECLRSALTDGKGRIEAVHAIGRHRVRSLLDETLSLQDPTDTELRSALLYCAQEMPDLRWLSLIQSCLMDDRLIEHASNALKSLGGQEIEAVHKTLSTLIPKEPSLWIQVPNVVSKLPDREAERWVASGFEHGQEPSIGAAVAILESRPTLSFPPERLHDTVMRLVRSIFFLRYSALVFSHDPKNVLVVSQAGYLEDRLKQALFRILTLLYPGRALQTVFERLTVRDVRFRAIAVESLNVILPKSLCEPITNLFDRPPLDEWHPYALKHYQRELRSESACIEEFSRHNDRWLNFCLYHANPSESTKNLQSPFPTQEVPTMLPTMDKVFFLKSIPLFAELPVEELFRLAGIANEEKFAPSDVIFKEGDYGDSLFVIVDGSVSVMKERSSEGHKQSVRLASLGEKQCFGEMAILTGEPRSADVVADRMLTALKIQKSDFRTILRNNSSVAEAIIRVLIERLRLSSQK